MGENLPFDFDTDSSRANSTKLFFDRLNSSTPKNLSQIFDEDLDPLRYESPRLRYPPSTLKQRGPPSFTSSCLPTEESSSESNEPQALAGIRMDLAFAKQVVVYQGRETGAMALALAIRSGNKEAKVILYKAKNQVITTLKLLPNGGTVHMRDSYVQFYDDTRDFWSLRFTREKHEHDFVRKMLDFNLPIKLHREESEDLHPPQARVDHDKKMDKREPHRVHTDHRDNNADHRDHNADHRDHNADHRGHRDHNGDHRAHNGDHREQRKDACGNNIRQRHHRDPDEPHPVAPQPKPRLRTPATTMENQPHSSEDQTPRSRQYMECLYSHFAIPDCDCRNCERRRRQLYRDPEEDEIVAPMPRPCVSSTASTETFDDPSAHLEVRTYIVDDTSSEYLGRDPSSDDYVTPVTPRLDRETTENRTDEDSSMRSSSARLIKRFLDYPGATEMEREIECILGTLQRKLGTSSSGEHKPKTKTTTTSGDSEDKMLQLEMSLVKTKMENREIVKTLKEHDQEMLEFQRASVTVLENVLDKNEKLQIRNSRLLNNITEINGTFGGAGRNGNKKGSGSGCENCDRYIKEIQLLKKQVADRDMIIRELDMR